MGKEDENPPDLRHPGESRGGDPRLGDPEDQALANENSPEFRAYMDEVYRRLPTYARRAATIPPGEKGSIEWLARVGKYWWGAREQEHLPRCRVAELAGAHVNSVRLLEFGLALETELSPEFLQRYATALGHPELYEEFQQKFNP